VSSANGEPPAGDGETGDAEGRRGDGEKRRRGDAETGRCGDGDIFHMSFDISHWSFFKVQDNAGANGSS
jgi:hypothetical protein